MGGRQSRLDRYYAGHEKAFQRIETDLERLNERLGHSQRRRSLIGLWSTVLVAGAVVIGAILIHQTQTRDYPYQEHFQRVSGALALPVAAGALHYLLTRLARLGDKRMERRIKALEDAKRTMIKELKDASSYERTKALIEKYDPDARRMPPPLPPGASQLLTSPQHSGRIPANGTPRAPHSPRILGPKLSMPRPGHMAGAAAAAVGSAGLALVPLIDRLATTLIADNPVLVEDLRRAQAQLEEAQRQAQEAARESAGLRAENSSLRATVAQLEAALGLPPSQPPPPASDDASSLGGAGNGPFGSGAGLSGLAGANGSAAALAPMAASASFGSLAGAGGADAGGAAAAEEAVPDAAAGEGEGPAAAGLRQRRGQVAAAVGSDG